MSLKIAIQPDEVLHRNGERQSYSERWSELARDQEIEVVPVDVFSRDVMPCLATCGAFMWRFPPTAYPRLYARRLLYAVEAGLGIPVFPSLKSSWHVEDKIGQAFFLSAAGIASPSTEILWTRAEAERFCEGATYPFVLKLSTGYQGSNVRLIHNHDEALFYLAQLFNRGVISLGCPPASRARLMLRRLRAAVAVLSGTNPYGPTEAADLQFGYLFAQEFLPSNEFDVRVTIIGDRAFVFRRFNRPGDFRASGSGRIDWDPDKIDEKVVRLGYLAARRTGAETVAVDILRRGSEPVIVELNLTYATWAIRDCPGHWILRGEPQTGELEWVGGSVRPEDAIFSDFMARIVQSQNSAV